MWLIIVGIIVIIAWLFYLDRKRNEQIKSEREKEKLILDNKIATIKNSDFYKILKKELHSQVLKYFQDELNFKTKGLGHSIEKISYHSLIHNDMILFVDYEKIHCFRPDVDGPENCFKLLFKNFGYRNIKQALTIKAIKQLLVKDNLCIWKDADRIMLNVEYWKPYALSILNSQKNAYLKEMKSID